VKIVLRLLSIPGKCSNALVEVQNTSELARRNMGRSIEEGDGNRFENDKCPI